MIWEFPEWMKKYLDYLPSMFPAPYRSDNERIKEIERYMNMDYSDLSNNNRLWCVLTGQIILLEMLHRSGDLK